MSHGATPECRDREPESLESFLEAEDGRYEKLFLEIKGTDKNRRQLTESLIELVGGHGVGSRVVVTSFYESALLYARETARGRGIEGIEFGLKLAIDSGTSLEFGCSGTPAKGQEGDVYEHDFDWALWSATLIDHMDVRLAHTQGHKVATWSGETPALIEKSMRLKVDGIYTDAVGFTDSRANSSR